MIVYSLLFITLLIACLALRLVYRSLLQRHWAKLAAGLSLSAFIYLYGAWIFLSAYTKYAFGAALMLTVLMVLRRRQAFPAIRIRHSGRYWPLSAILLLISILYFTGTEGRTEYVDLAFPMHGTHYYVFQGGKGLPANVFHYGAHREVYAQDIVKLDAAGRRCKQIFSKHLADYYIFGDTIYSPCSGIIRRAVDSNPDNIPPHRVAGIRKLNGVLIEADGYFVYLGHLQRGGVFVQEGQSVAAGQPIGLAGNSGMSIEPHLHIQVHKKGLDGRPWYEQPQLYIRFGGRAYLLFEEIHPKAGAR